MDDLKNYKFFLLIKKDKIIFALLDKNNEISFQKELSADKPVKKNNLHLLNQFLNQNLIYFEKKFKHFVKEINLIIDTDESISISLSTINSFSYSDDISDNTLNKLLNLKNDVMKNINNYDLIHMCVEKFIINNKSFSKMPDYNFKENIFLEINFDLINKDYIKELKNILSKYEILVRRISNYKYVNLFNDNNNDNIFRLTDKLNNGYNQNEIYFKKSELKENGIFAKFFNIFT